MLVIVQGDTRKRITDTDAVRLCGVIPDEPFKLIDVLTHRVAEITPSRPLTAKRYNRLVSTIK